MDNLEFMILTTDLSVCDAGTGTLAEEWGNAPFQVPHRLNVTFDNQSGRRFRLQFVIQAQNVTNHATYTG